MFAEHEDQSISQEQLFKQKVKHGETRDLCKILGKSIIAQLKQN